MGFGGDAGVSRRMGRLPPGRLLRAAWVIGRQAEGGEVPPGLMGGGLEFLYEGDIWQGFANVVLPCAKKVQY